MMWLVSIHFEVNTKHDTAAADNDADATTDDDIGPPFYDARIFHSSHERDHFLASILTKDDNSNNNTRIISGYTVQKVVTAAASSSSLSNVTTAHESKQKEVVVNKDDNNHNNKINKNKNTIRGNTGNDDEEEDVEDFDLLVKRFELFRRVVEHEDDLLNQRMSWMILAQSFLMGAYITAHETMIHTEGGEEEEYYGGDDDGGGHHTTEDTRRTTATAAVEVLTTTMVENGRSFLYITAGVGLLTVLVTLPALIAAGKNIEIQQRVYFLGLPSDTLCRKLHGHDRDMKYHRKQEYHLRHQHRPNLIRDEPNTNTNTNNITTHILPNTSFRADYGMPILTTVILLSLVQVVGWCCLLGTLWMEEK